MELAWTDADANRLAQHYQSFVTDLEAKALRSLVLSGLEGFIHFPEVCRSALEVAQETSRSLQKKFQTPELRQQLDSLRQGRLSDAPADMIAVAEASNAFRQRLDEMHAQRDAFFDQYTRLFEGALTESIRAAKALSAKIEGGSFLSDFTQTALMDASGALLPGLGTVAFLKRRVLEKSKHLHQQLQHSAGIADSFVIFSEYMAEMTQQMKTAQRAVREDAAVLADYVEQELPMRIKALNALKAAPPA